MALVIILVYCLLVCYVVLLVLSHGNPWLWSALWQDLVIVEVNEMFLSMLYYDVA